jgi:hypothetical protein
VLIGHGDRTRWTTIADRLAGEVPGVFDMAVDADNNLCVGGSFNSIVNTAAGYIASGAGAE